MCHCNMYPRLLYFQSVPHLRMCAERADRLQGAKKRKKKLQNFEKCIQHFKEVQPDPRKRPAGPCRFHQHESDPKFPGTSVWHETRKGTLFFFVVVAKLKSNH